MPREAKLLLTAENKGKTVIRDAEGDLGGFEKTAVRVGETLKTALGAAAIVSLGKSIGTFAVQATQAFGDVDRTMTQLRAAVGGSEGSFTKLTSLIDEMGGKTLESKDQVEKLVAEIRSLGKSDSQVEQITKATVALSNVTGKSLNDAFTAINATFTGTAGKIEKLVPELGTLTSSQLEAGAAVDLLIKKFGAISDSMSTGIAQDFSNLTKTTDDLKEAIGANLAPTFQPLIQWIDRVAQGWNTSLTAMASYHKSQKEFSIAAQTEAIKSLEAQLAKQDADIKKRRTQYALYENPSDAEWLRVAELDRTETITQINEVSARLRAISTTLPNYSQTEIPGLPGASYGAGGTGGSAAANDGNPWSDQDKRYRQGFGGREGVSSGPGNVGLSSNSLNPFAGILKFADQFATGFGSMFTALSSVQAILNPITTILTATFEVIGPLLNEVLAPIVGMLRVIGTALGELITPVIIALGKVINFVMEGILWVWNGIVKAINWALGWLGVHLNTATLSSVSAAGDTSSTSTSTGASASYTGARTITLNFYNQGNVVGSGGMEELAALIASLIKRQERYA